MDARFHLVESFADLEAFFRWLGERRTWLSIDTETGGLDWWRDPLRLVQVGDAHAGWAIPWGDWAGAIKEVVPKYDGPIAFQNVKFDLHFLEHNGVIVPRHLLHDTQVMTYLNEPHLPKGLKQTSDRHISPAASYGQKALSAIMKKNKWGWDTVPIDLPEYWQYAALDVVLTSRIAEMWWPSIEQSYRKVYDTEVAVAIVLKDMEAAGMRVDLPFCRNESGRIRDYEAQMEEWFVDTWGLENPNSNKQQAEAIMRQGIALYERTPKGEYAMGKEILGNVDHPLAQALLEYRTWAKMRSTYFDDFLKFSDENGYIHTSINPLGARTGRKSAERPNLQNVPKNWVRNSFLASEGSKLLLIDFDQIELRLMAHYAEEESLVQAVHDGEDLHNFVGRLIYNVPNITDEQRDVVKAANFAKIYGAGIDKFAATAGISKPEAQQFMSMYEARFPAIVRFIRNTTYQAKGLAAQDQSLITPYLGRPQRVGDPDKAYKMVNYFIQGTAADVLKRKMVEVSMTEAGKYMRLPIHDEIAFDVPEDLVEDVRQEAISVMEENEAFSLPLSVGADVVDRWGDKYG